MDLGAIVNAVRRTPTAADARATGDRIAVSLRVLLPIVESVGATPELARELRARMTTGAVAVIVPAGSGQARVDLGHRQIAIPAALREAILVALEQTAARAQPSNRPVANALPAAAALATAGPAPAAPMPVAPMPAAPLIDQAAAARLIGAGAPAGAFTLLHEAELAKAGGASRDPMRAERETPRPAHATFGTPLLDAGSGSDAAAARLRAAVERSGLFFESHLAAWVRASRSSPAADVPVDDPRAPAATPSAARTAAQLDVLAGDAVQLHGPVWPGQTATIELRRERSDTEARGEDPDADAVAAAPAAVFGARLRIDLPVLGALDIRLRLAGTTVAVAVASPSHALIEGELTRLGSQFELRGLQPVALVASPPQ